jgi:putative ABC transport system permease protein
MRLLEWRKQREQDLEEEIQAHLRMAIRDRMERGETREHAEAAARREFGNVLLVKDVTRDMWGWTWPGQLLQDLGYALRQLRRSPGFTIVAVLTLAIGMGANTAVFSVIDTILLRPLPYRDPDQLVRLYETEAAPGNYPFAPPDYLDWKAQNKTFADMALFGWFQDMNLSGEGRPDHVLGVPTEANFFSLLGVNPLLGRTWAAGEDQPGKGQEVILSYGLWRSLFAGKPGAIGQTVELNSRKYTIVGVMPANFRFPSRAQLWIPLAMDSKSLGRRGNHWTHAIGRLKPNAGIHAAQADLALIASRLEQQYPDSNHKVGAAVVRLHDDLVGNSRDSLLMMLSAVGLVLLIACANVANLLLSRAVARQKEMAVRSALGAARLRLLRQLLTESLLLALVGGVLGLLVARGIIGLFSSARLPQFNLIQLNGAVLAFTSALVVATGVLFGVFPALQTSRPDLHEELKGGAGGANSPGRRRTFTSDALVVAEIALSLLLLVSAGLLLKDFFRLRNTDIGVRTEGVWTAAIQLPEANYKTQQQALNFAQALLEQSRRIPGVETAAVTNRLPPEGGGNYYVKLRGQLSPRQSGQLVEAHAVSPEYFRAMGVRLLKGRLFTPADVQATLALDLRMRRVAEAGVELPAEQTNAMVYPSVINESMARYFWPNQNPLGQMFSPGSDNGPWREVVGVVNDVRQRGLANQAAPEAYDVFDGRTRLYLVLHTSLQPSGLTAPVRRALGQLDSGLPLFSIRTMDEVIADQAQGQQFLSLLVGSFAGLALLLAAVGIYGVLSYAVTQRTREIGIRMSLGATRRRVLGQVLRKGMRLALLGVAGGVAGAFAAGRVLASLLHEVKPGDPMILIAAAGLLAVVALVACYLPARRAARVDPMTALRYE